MSEETTSPSITVPVEVTTEVPQTPPPASVPAASVVIEEDCKEFLRRALAGKVYTKSYALMGEEDAVVFTDLPFEMAELLTQLMQRLDEDDTSAEAKFLNRTKLSLFFSLARCGTILTISDKERRSLLEPADAEVMMTTVNTLFQSIPSERLFLVLIRLQRNFQDHLTELCKKVTESAF